jgi:DNA-binding phage protein
MITKRELTQIKKALPENGYQLIAEKAGTSKEAIRKVLSEPKRYNPTIIKTALSVIKDYKQEILALKTEIKEVTA